MKPLIALLLVAAPALAQIEATDPAAGILIVPKILYRGQLLAAGMSRADAVRILGQVKTIEKPRATSSAKLLADFSAAATIVHRTDLEIAMRDVRMGRPIPPPTENFAEIATAYSRLVVDRCGACSIELLERQLGKAETLRLVLLDGAIAAVLLDKSRNAVRAELQTPWTGHRIIYQGDQAVRITQSPGSFKVEDLDPATGTTKL